MSERLGPVKRAFLGLVSFGLASLPQPVEAQRIAQASIECKTLINEEETPSRHLVGHLKVTQIPVKDGYTIWFYVQDDEIEKDELIGSNVDGEDTYERELIDGIKHLPPRRQLHIFNNLSRL